MDRIDDFIDYHYKSAIAKDIDLQVEAIADLRLGTEDRLWISYLFSSCYCFPTAYFMFRQIPTPFSKTRDELQDWWVRNKGSVVFTTDRSWLRRLDQWVDNIESYKSFIERYSPNRLQGEAIEKAIEGCSTPQERCDQLFRNAGLYVFARFAEFLFSELVYYAGFDIVPELLLEDAESVKNGMCFIMGVEETAYTGRHGRSSTEEELEVLRKGLDIVFQKVEQLDLPDRYKRVWPVETTLCAYKKFMLGKRWIGYYVERAKREMEQMKSMNPGFDFGEIDRGNPVPLAFDF